MAFDFFQMRFFGKRWVGFRLVMGEVEWMGGSERKDVGEKMRGRMGRGVE